MSIEEKGMVKVEDFAAPTLAQTLTGAASAFYTSLPQESRMEKAQLLNALQSPDHKADEVIGKTIMLKNFIAQSVPIVDELTGEISDAVRIVLVSEKNESVVFVSKGVFNSVKMLISIFGAPAVGGWAEAIPVKLVQLATKKGRTYNLVVVTKKVDPKDENVIA